MARSSGCSFDEGKVRDITAAILEECVGMSQKDRQQVARFLMRDPEVAAVVTWMERREILGRVWRGDAGQLR